MPPPEGSGFSGEGGGGAVNCEKGWMAGSQGENGTPTTFGTASVGLGEMAALWLVPTASSAPSVSVSVSVSISVSVSVPVSVSDSVSVSVVANVLTARALELPCPLSLSTFFIRVSCAQTSSMLL